MTVYDLAVVGGGIVGLAHALVGARRGLRVALFERHGRALGASIRNFGTIFSIGQAGVRRRRALRGREIWRELLQETGWWHVPQGALFVAYREKEQVLLQAFAEIRGTEGYDCRLIDAPSALAMSPGLQADGLRGALFSQEEIGLDPRQVIAEFPAYLSDKYGVSCYYNHPVSDVAVPLLTAGGKRFEAERVVVCGGSDFAGLYPREFAASGMVPCKLQMMRTAPQPNGWQLGPMLATGLSLCRYASFADLPGRAELRAELEAEYPRLYAHDIHVMAAQNGMGEVLIGDSHHYGQDPDPFDSAEVNQLIMSYLCGFLTLPDPHPAASWHGVYITYAQGPQFTASPEPGVRIVTGIGGAGLTTAFALAEETLTNW